MSGQRVTLGAFSFNTNIHNSFYYKNILNILGKEIWQIIYSHFVYRGSTLAQNSLKPEYLIQVRGNIDLSKFLSTRSLILGLKHLSTFMKY